MSLKTEVQSQSGLLSIVREQYTPDAKEMSEKAFREYEKTEKITKEKLINHIIACIYNENLACCLWKKRYSKWTG